MTGRFAFGLLGLILLAGAAPVRAQEFPRNAFGFYAAPTLYGFVNGTEYSLAENGGGVDIGVYYARFVTRALSLRIEARYGTRHMDDVVELHDPFSSFVLFRLSETVLQFPLIVQGDRRIMISDHELRVSVGAGPTLSHVLEQKLLIPSGEHPLLEPTDSYQRFGLVFDGGVTFSVKRTSAIFARYRLDLDHATLSAPEDADVIRRFWSTGFLAGFEYGF